MAFPFPLNDDAFAFLARYALAGFIIFMIRNAYVVGERPKLGEIAFDVLLFSLINRLVWALLSEGGSLVHAGLGALTEAPERLDRIVPTSTGAFFLEVLALPFLIGIVSGHALRWGWARGVLRVVSLPVVDPIPRAYDHVFSTRGPGFVILSFKDGRTIHGYYGPASRAGRDPGRSEIFLERLYVVDDDGQWLETLPPRAALISLDGLRAIEFIDGQGSNENET